MDNKIRTSSLRSQVEYDAEEKAKSTSKWCSLPEYLWLSGKPFIGRVNVSQDHLADACPCIKFTGEFVQ